jgi:hypothetical protein
MFKLVAFVALLALPSMVQAQTAPDVNNPSAVTFTASIDHAKVESYDVLIIRPTGAILQTLNVGKPVPDATNTCTVQLNVQPIDFGIGYTLRVVAKAGTATSDPANSENKFNRIPGPPSKVIAK